MDKLTGKKITKMLPLLNEKQKRMYLATEAEALGWGGTKAISKLTGVSQTTIIKGKKEINSDKVMPGSTRIRKKGGGRKKIGDTQKGLKDALEKLVDADTFGNPENPLRWTTKSLRNLTDELKKQGFVLCYNVVRNLLIDLEYSLQLNKKCLQLGDAHPDRDQQFKYINALATQFMLENEPVISVDTKKKENIGNFKNNGGEYHKHGTPQKVLDHDFPIKELGKVNPYGIYDISKNTGFINLGISHDTSEFAIESIYRWWEFIGSKKYPGATKLLITCDGGGSNGSRVKLWKVGLQKLADKIPRSSAGYYVPIGSDYISGASAPKTE
jgi:hypothetical protein